MAMPPQPESILLRENGTWGRLYTMSLPPIQVTADKPEEEEEKAPWYERAWNEVARVGSETIDGWIGGAKTVWEALPFTSDEAVTEAARQRIGDGVMGTLEGLATLMGPSPELINYAYISGDPDALALVEQLQENQQGAVGAIGDAIKGAWDAAYERNGTAGATAMVLATLGVEVVGGKGTAGLAKAAEKVAEIVRLAKTPMEAANKLDEAITAARAAGATAEEIDLLERARNQRLAQARRDSAKGTDGVAVKKGRLAPNSSYSLNGYKYTTDAQGRIKTVEGELRLDSAERSKHAQRTVGADDGRLPDDHGGHLIGSQFGGFEGYENLTPMASEINKYPNGKWGKMEENWAQALRDKKSVKVHVELIYTDDTMRAGRFKVTEIIDGNPKVRVIENPR
jgi:hypothetical protein